MVSHEDAMALWFGRELSAVAGNATQEILLEDVSERVAEGTDLEAALGAVTKHEARAGDFGVEVVGSLVAVALVEGLKTFWAAYLRELEEKAGTSLADKTLDYFKSKFRSATKGPESVAIGAKIKAAIEASAAKLKVPAGDLAPTLDAIGPTLAKDGSDVA
jgi:hypothetical protein